MDSGRTSRWWLLIGFAASLVAISIAWRAFTGPSDQKVVWQAMQQIHRQVLLPEGAVLVERQATEPGFWSSICFGITTGCPRDERTYAVGEYRVSAERLRDMLAGIPLSDVQQECLTDAPCRVSGTVRVNDELSFVLEVSAPRHGGDTTSVVGVHTTPTD